MVDLSRTPDGRRADAGRTPSGAVFAVVRRPAVDGKYALVLLRAGGCGSTYGAGLLLAATEYLRAMGREAGLAALASAAKQIGIA